MSPEPIIVVTDGYGVHSLCTEVFPLRTVINRDLPWKEITPAIGFDDATGIVRVSLGEKTAIYDRIGYTLNGEWICDLRSGNG